MSKMNESARCLHRVSDVFAMAPRPCISSDTDIIATVTSAPSLSLGSTESASTAMLIWVSPEQSTKFSQIMDNCSRRSGTTLLDPRDF